MHRVRIGAHAVGAACRAFVVAEVGQAHEGSVGTAHAYIDAVADAGADAVKFQTHIASAESTRDEPFRIRFSSQDATRYDYWRRMEFPEAAWRELAHHAQERGLLFLSSAFSVDAVELLSRLDMPAWKVGSGEFRSHDLIDAMVRTGRPILLSTGMSRMDEIGAMVERVTQAGCPLVLLQCTSKYPLPMEEVGLNVIDDLRERFGLPVGLSDHSGSLWPATAAISRGADMVEVHVVLDRRVFGPDTTASLTVDQLALLVEARDAVATMLSSPVDKDAMARELEGMRGLFTKSVAPVRDLPAGTILEHSMLTTKKPGTGIPADRLESFVGRRLARDVSADRLLRPEDLVAP